MPIEQQDNTRMVQPLFISRPPKEIREQANKKKAQEAINQNQAQLWDKDQIDKYQRMQDFYNNNAWGYGISGTQTRYDPRTQQAAIQANFDYAKDNVKNFGETLILTGVGEGLGEVAKWATTSKKIGSGAEAVVESAPASLKVKKTTTIPRSEMHLRNQVPGALRAEYTGTSNGLSTYIQNKVKILSQEQLGKAVKSLEGVMKKKGWRTITHPNLQGVGFTNGRYVVSDIGVGNVGRTLFGKPKLVDFVIETVPDFRLAMQKNGGVILNIN